MWAREFVRSLKYDAVPRTIGLIEQFNREAYASFDTMHGAESQYSKCTQCNNTVLNLRGVTTEHPCRSQPKD